MLQQSNEAKNTNKNNLAFTRDSAISKLCCHYAFLRLGMPIRSAFVITKPVCIYNWAALHSECGANRHAKATRRRNGGWYLVWITLLVILTKFYNILHPYHGQQTLFWTPYIFLMWSKPLRGMGRGYRP